MLTLELKNIPGHMQRQEIWAVLGRPGHVSIRASLAATARRGMVRSRGFQGKEAKKDGKTADDSWQPFQLQSCTVAVAVAVVVVI